MATRLVKTRTFTAVSDTGRQFTIYEYTPFTGTYSSEDHGRVSGGHQLRTDTGLRVNRHDEGVYSIPALGDLRVRSNDPDAP